MSAALLLSGMKFNPKRFLLSVAAGSAALVGYTAYQVRQVKLSHERVIEAQKKEIEGNMISTVKIWKKYKNKDDLEESVKATRKRFHVEDKQYDHIFE